MYKILTIGYPLIVNTFKIIYRRLTNRVKENTTSQVHERENIDLPNPYWNLWSTSSSLTYLLPNTYGNQPLS